MTVHQGWRSAIAQELGKTFKRWTFFLILAVFLVLSYSFPCYAMPQGLVVQPAQGASYSVLGDLYTIKAMGEDTGNAYALTEILVQPQNATPLHIHSREDEAFYIQEGELEFQLGDQTIVATAGTFLHSPKGQVHAFKNLGAKPAKMLCWVIPAGLEKFFAEVGVSVVEQTVVASPVSSAAIKKVLVTAPKYGLEIVPHPSEASRTNSRNS